MVDIKDIRRDPESFRQASRDKGLDPAVIDRILELDTRRRTLETISNKQRECNKLVRELIFQKKGNWDDIKLKINETISQTYDANLDPMEFVEGLFAIMDNYTKQCIAKLNKEIKS